MDVRKADGTKTELIEGKWYVGVNWLDGSAYEGQATGPSYGEIAKYVGDGEFYDDSDWLCEAPIRMQDYEYLLEQA